MDTNTVVTADPADVEKNKVMAILAYIIFFIPLLAAKDSKFAMYHANQGTWLFIIGLIVYVVLTFVTFGCGALFAWLPWTIYAILGIVNASQGKMQPLPGFASLPTLFK
jgi:uncharacterized membrane protein